MLSKLNTRIKKIKRLEKQSNTPCSKAAKKLNKYTKVLKYFAISFQIFVPFFHKPLWCIERFKNKDEAMFETCGFNVTGVYEEYDDEYGLESKMPNVGIPAS